MIKCEAGLHEVGLRLSYSVHKVLHRTRFIQGAPDPVISGVIWSCNSYKWSCKWETGVRTLLIGAITPSITGRGPPCMYIHI